MEKMKTEKIILRGRKVVGGCAEGEALVTRDTISGWGGIDPMTGTIIEMRHELRGQSFKDKVLVFQVRKAHQVGQPSFIPPGWRGCPQGDDL